MAILPPISIVLANNRKNTAVFVYPLFLLLVRFYGKSLPHQVEYDESAWYG